MALQKDSIRKFFIKHRVMWLNGYMQPLVVPCHESTDISQPYLCTCTSQYIYCMVYIQ